MARVSRRLGRLGVDYTDATGKRRWKSFRDEAQAQVFLGKVLIESGRPLSSDPTLTMAEYAPRWLAVAAVRVRATSLVRYRRVIKNQILPALGLYAVSALTAPQIRDWIAGLMSRETKPLAKASVAQVLEVLSQILNQAVDDGIARENVAKGLSRKMRLTSKLLGREIRAFTTDQLTSFLRTAETIAPQWHLAYYILAVTGMRLGEAFGLRWSDVDAAGKTIRIERQIREDGVVADPKSERSRRTIDVGDALLAKIAAERELREGLSPWVLNNWPETPSQEQVVQARNAIRYAMRAVLKQAKLPAQLTPHSFRHTWASIHLSRGEPIKWVSESLGHETISITCDLYGRWMRSERQGAAASLERLVSGD